MAKIYNSIHLHDKMSPVLRNITRAMNSTLNAMRNIDTQSKKSNVSSAYSKASKDIKRAEKAVRDFERGVNLANRELQQTNNISQKVAKNMNSMKNGGFNLANLAGGLYLLRSIASAIAEISAVPDSLLATQYRLDTYDTTSATGGQLFDYAYKVAQDSRSQIESTSNLGSRILISGATGGNAIEALDLAGTFNKSSFLGGSSADESQRALLQLSQALASGNLQGDELRAIREQASGLTDVMAKGLSKLAEKGILDERFLNTSIGDLKKLGAEGELTSNRIIMAFKEMQGYVDKTFDNSPKQFSQAMAGILNVWKRWLKLLAEGDGALAILNRKTWQLLEWLESDTGQKFMTGLANGLTFLVSALVLVVEGIGTLVYWFTSLADSSETFQAVLAGMFVTISASAIKTGITISLAFLKAMSPLLPLFTLVSLVTYALLQAGFTVDDILGGIWAFAFVVGSVIKTIFMSLLLFIGTLAIGAGTAVRLAVMGAVQLINWFGAFFASAFEIMGAIGMSIGDFILIGIRAGATGAVQLIVWMAQGVLSVLETIASGIDWLFGSNLAESIRGWSGGLGSFVSDFVDRELTKAGGELGNDIYDRFDDALRDSSDHFSKADMVGDIMEDVNNSKFLMKDLVNFTTGNMDDIGVSYWNGQKAGRDFSKGIGDFNIDMKLPDISSVSSMNYNDGIIKGGDLDSVGKINSDVSINDEDIKLIRDMVARDYLINLQQITPKATINFGDVRETADVAQILDVIQDMIDEHLATSLIVESQPVF